MDEKQRELDAVQAKYDQAMRDKQMLVDDAEACRRKMANATALIDGLGGEKTRWTEQSKKFDQQIQRCDSYSSKAIFIEQNIQPKSPEPWRRGEW